MDYLAGIDLGSTTLKAVIYDTARQHHRQRVPADRALPSRPGASGMDGVAAGADLGRQRGRH